MDKSRFHESCAITENKILIPVKRIGEQNTLYYLLEIQKSNNQIGYHLTKTFEQTLSITSDYITGYEDNFFLSTSEEGGFKIDSQGNITHILDKTSSPYFIFDNSLCIISEGKVYASEDLGISWVVKSEKPEFDQLRQLFVVDKVLIGLDQNKFWYYFNTLEKTTILEPFDELEHIKFVVNFNDKLLTNNLNNIYEIKGLE